MKFFHQIKRIVIFTSLLISTSAFSDIEQERTNSVGRSDGTWETGLQVPSDDQANDECNIVAGLPFSCTLPTSGGGTVTCNPISIPGGVTLSSSCLLAGTSSSDFAIDVEFNDGVSDPVTKTVNLTAGPNQSPTIADPIGCSTPKSGFAWSCDVASSVSDPEGQTLSYSLGAGAPSWASLSGSTLSGTPTSSGSIGIPYDVSDGVNIVSYTYNINIAVGTAEALEGDDPISTALLDDAGVSPTMTAALNTNTCGASGDQSCLTAFNNQRSTTACSLAGGSSATASQMEDYVSCVVIESYTNDASSVSTTPPSATAASGCGQSVNVPMPAMCNYSAWNCPITNLPSGWVNNGASVTIPASVSPTNITLNVEMRLGSSWSGYLIKTVSQPVNVAAAVEGASNGYKLFVNDDRLWEVWAAYDTCQAEGGNLATLAEAEASGVLNGATWYMGQKEGQTTRPSVVNWTGSDQGTDYKAASEDGTQKYIGDNIYVAAPGSYVCATKNRNSCGGNSPGGRYYVCKDLPSCN